MLNIADLLRNAPKGTKLYSPLFGEVEYMQLGDNDKIWIKVDNAMGLGFQYEYVQSGSKKYKITDIRKEGDAYYAEVESY